MLLTSTSHFLLFVKFLIFFKRKKVTKISITLKLFLAVTKKIYNILQEEKMACRN